jgi:hypothetical protein
MSRRSAGVQMRAAKVQVAEPIGASRRRINEPFQPLGDLHAGTMRANQQHGADNDNGQNG